MSGTALALVAIFNCATRLLDTVGLNLTLMLHDAPAANIAGQFSVITNASGLGPVMEMLSTVNDVVPLLMSVVARGPLVVPTGTVPKLRTFGFTNEAGVTVSIVDFVIWLPKRFSTVLP